MYVHSVVVKMCWDAGCHIWKSENWVYTGFGICHISSRHAAKVLPLPRFFFQNHKLEKVK